MYSLENCGVSTMPIGFDEYRFRFLLIVIDEVPDSDLDIVILNPRKDKPDANCRIFLFSLSKVACSNSRNVECLQYIEYSDSILSPYLADKSDPSLQANVMHCSSFRFRFFISDEKIM